MAEGITGWRLHVGVIFPTPVPPRAVLEFYEAVPEGIDMTTVSLTIQQLSDNDMDEAIKGMERAAKQRSEEHTSELQSLTNLVCRLLLEKKKNKKICYVQMTTR